MRWEWERARERTRERTRERVRESVRFRRVRWECCCHTPLSRVELVFRRSQWNNFQSTNECPRESSLPPQQRKRKKTFLVIFFLFQTNNNDPTQKSVWQSRTFVSLFLLLSDTEEELEDTDQCLLDIFRMRTCGFWSPLMRVREIFAEK